MSNKTENNAKIHNNNAKLKKMQKTCNNSNIVACIPTMDKCHQGGKEKSYGIIEIYLLLF